MIDSVRTNMGAMTALQSLQATQESLTNTENQISTGLKVNTAKDDASSWVVSTTMKANIASLNQVSQNLGNADSILGTAVSGAGTIAGLISQIRAKVASATDPATNVAATQNEVDQMIAQIGATVGSSSFNGVNLLDNSHTAGLTFVAATNNSYASGGTSATIATGAAIDLTTTAAGSNATMAALYNLVDSGGSGGGLAAIAAGTTTIDSALQTIDVASNTVNSAAAQYGAVQQNVEAQQTFVNNLASTFQGGVSNMVDANMTTESAQLSALQVQQQLGTQALSIANSAPQMILKLFGG